MERKKLVRSILGQVLGIGIGSWVGTVLGVTLANWQRGELSAAGFGWTVWDAASAAFGVGLFFSQSSWRHRKERTGRERDCDRGVPADYSLFL